ncbi:MAG: hypothetical protein ABIG89_05625 [Candidatus Woesearchaeota archaeon]
MIDRDKILQVMQLKGPIIPKDLLKNFDSDTFMIGAALSELASNGHVIITHLKMGGSPFYYLPKHIEKIQDLNRFLNEKDNRAFQLLKLNKILKDKELTPILRVSLREIKDFAKPIEVKLGSDSELFWKWYMLSDSECNSLLKENYFNELSQEKKKEVDGGTVHSAISEMKQSLTQQIGLSTPQLIQHPTELPAQQPVESSIPSPTESQNMQIVQNINGAQEIQEKSSSSQSSQSDKTFNQPVKKDNLKPKEEQKGLFGDDSVSSDKPQQNYDDDLFKKIKKYFNKHTIIVSDVNIIRKNKEVDCIVGIPSPIGTIEYFCRAKTKKKCNDGDLATIYLDAQSKNLPALFITTGDVTNKARENLEIKFKNMKIVFLN